MYRTEFPLLGLPLIAILIELEYVRRRLICKFAIMSDSESEAKGDSHGDNEESSDCDEDYIMRRMVIYFMHTEESIDTRMRIIMIHTKP
jgi:hypothetical protein